MNEAGTESLVSPVESSIVTGVSVKDPHECQPEWEVSHDETA